MIGILFNYSHKTCSMVSKKRNRKKQKFFFSER